ncbi:MAG: N-6 DNA methylase [Acidimicrobiales bacterium]
MSSPVASIIEASSGDDAEALAAVVSRVSEARGVSVDLVVGDRVVDPDPGVLGLSLDEELLRHRGHLLPGLVREALTASPVRRRSGVHHTPAGAARRLVDLALGSLERRDLGGATVADPAVGGGVFLIAAGESLLQAGAARSPGEVVDRLVGLDVDPLAVAVSRASVGLWAGRPIEPDSIRVADFLASPSIFPQRIEAVIGNPPFGSQLRGPTVRGEVRRRLVRDRWPGVGGYVDDAALFLLAALDVVTPRGVVGFVLPTSILAARDAESVRRRVHRVGSIAGFCHHCSPMFDAAVDTCALVIRRGRESGGVRVTSEAGGPTPSRAPTVTNADRWATLQAVASGVPAVELDESGPRLGAVARCTAGFRDQFYGLRSAVIDDADAPLRLITSGLIDPLRSLWGRRRCRYAGHQYEHPAVVPARADPAITGWLEARLRPKLVVATQTAVIEAAVDVDGTWVPCTPVVSVEPHDDQPGLWHLAAAISAPPVVAWLSARLAGSALSSRAVRISARRLATVPLPPRGAAWDRAAEAARAAADRGSLGEFGAAAAAAYGCDDEELLRWWTRRLPAPG